MTLNVAYAIIGVMTALAAYALIATIRLREQTWNQELAWPCRERLATLAYEVEDQEGVPPLVRTSICFLADRAFDIAFMKSVLRSEEPKTAARLVAQIRQEYPDNPEFGDMVAEALSMMTRIVLLSDQWGVQRSRHIVEQVLAQGAHAHGASESRGDFREERKREEEIPRFAGLRQKVAMQLAANVPGLIAGV